MLVRANELPGGLTQTMDTLLHLRTAVGVKLDGVKKDIKSIVGYFSGYEEKQKQRGHAILTKGVSFFEGLL